MVTDGANYTLQNIAHVPEKIQKEAYSILFNIAMWRGDKANTIKNLVAGTAITSFYGAAAGASINGGKGAVIGGLTGLLVPSARWALSSKFAFNYINGKYSDELMVKKDHATGTYEIQAPANLHL